MTKNTARAAKNKKVATLFFFATLLIPVLFFLLLELGLRLFGYGLNDEQWVRATAGKLMLNPDIARKYFRVTRTVPISNQDVFDEHKKADAFRVFVLGESSAAGYPFTPIGSFSRWLRARLTALYPDCTIEVVNLSLTAVNSYTLRDLFPAVVEQKPDLVLIYAGHNEYYGALGVGSAESAGTNIILVRLALFLSTFKTYELLQNTIEALTKLVVQVESSQKDGTLMARMARDQQIGLDSEVFLLGLAQFEANLRDILELSKEHGIPVILGTVVSNLKDQKPFISLKDGLHPDAQSVFDRAHRELEGGEPRIADSLFRLAKDLDALRFRAPEAMNGLIRQLGGEFGLPVAHVDSVFNAASPDGIVGNNLMTDHLHPTLRGYEIMGRSYFEVMSENGLLPKREPVHLEARTLDSLTGARFPFAPLDSIIASYRITLLKNDWPFVENEAKVRSSLLISPDNFIERAAYDVVTDKEAWEATHRKVAAWYLAQKDYFSFRRIMDVLISQYPVVVEYYDYAATELLKAGEYDTALPYLDDRHRVKPDVFSAKWMGIIRLSKNETGAAILFLEESRRYDSTDAQVLYNLSGAYSYVKEFPKALDAINRCLEIDPLFPKAGNLKAQLEKIAASK